MSHTDVLKISLKCGFTLICSVCWIIGFEQMGYDFFFWVISYFNSPICCTICAPHSCSVFYWTSAQAGNLTAWNPNNGLGVCTGNQAISSSHMSYSTPSLDLNGDSFSWLHTLKLSVLAGGQRAARAWTPSAEGQFAKEGPGGKVLCLCWLRAPL